MRLLSIMINLYKPACMNNLCLLARLKYISDGRKRREEVGGGGDEEREAKIKEDC